MRKLGVDEHITLILQLIPKIEQNVLFPLPVPKIIVCVRGGGGARQYNVLFPCSQTIGKALGSVHLNAYERGDY